MYCRLVRLIEAMTADDATVKPPVIAFNSGRFKVVSGCEVPDRDSDPFQYSSFGIEIVASADGAVKTGE
jgi:hypothetical protein